MQGPPPDHDVLNEQIIESRVTEVYLADGARARAVEVQLGRRDKEWVEVIGPIPPNARVITTGPTQLVDGAAIRVR